MTILFSQRLPEPRLRFDYALKTQVSGTSFDGFKQYGPYDKHQPRKSSFTCVILYPRWASAEMQKVKTALVSGMFFFRGFKAFSRGVTISTLDEISLDCAPGESLEKQASAYRKAIHDLPGDPAPDLIIALIPYTPKYLFDTPYYAAKLEASARGIPCQLLALERLKADESLKWSLANIGLQIYAKLGNVPWVVEAPDVPNDMIIGIGRREVRASRIGSLKRYMGFTTAYKNNGAFLTFQGLSPVGSVDDYCGQLSNAVESALRQFQLSSKKRPDRVVFHSFKKVGEQEIRALEDGISSGTDNATALPYALVHIDEFGNFLLFDGDHKTYLPASGYAVGLGALQGLLMTEGNERYERRKMGFPAPLIVRLDHRSKLDEMHLPQIYLDLLYQVFSLSKVNWRGFNAAAIPVTLNYSRLIAELIASCRDTDLWAQISAASGLRNKAWFL